MQWTIDQPISSREITSCLIKEMDPCLKTIAHLEHRQIHRDQDYTNGQTQKNDEQRFQYSTDGIGLIFELVGLLVCQPPEKVLRLVYFYGDLDHLYEFGRIKFKFPQARRKAASQ